MKTNPQKSPARASARATQSTWPRMKHGSNPARRDCRNQTKTDLQKIAKAAKHADPTFANSAPFCSKSLSEKQALALPSVGSSCRPLSPGLLLRSLKFSCVTKKCNVCSTDEIHGHMNLFIKSVFHRCFIRGDKNPLSEAEISTVGSTKFAKPGCVQLRGLRAFCFKVFWKGNGRDQQSTTCGYFWP